MEFSTEFSANADKIIALIGETFAASEGASEGKAIAGLVRKLITTTDPADLFVITAFEKGRRAGAIIFSRIKFDQDDRTVFILSPVAVKTDKQGQGIGQRLIKWGLAHIRKSGVDVALTYGDPNYYGKVGFQQITEDQAKAPLPLNHPHGWLALALDGGKLRPLKGSSHCVDALDDVAFW